MLPGVAGVILPVAARRALLPALFADARIASLRRRAVGRRCTSPSRWSRYALFVVAALQALVLTGLEQRLHRGVAAASAAPARRRC